MSFRQEASFRTFLYTQDMIIGIDEVGRGPLAGPVTVCAFTSPLNEEELLSIFPSGILQDSKKLTAKKRALIFTKLQALHKEKKVYWCVGERSAKEIDDRGISTCIKECVSEILDSLQKEYEVSPQAMHIFLDGSLHADKSYTNQETIVRGDEKVVHIALASIIAKELRDDYMKKEGAIYPHFGFEKHAGYGTAFHLDAIQKHGPSPLHRRSFLKKILLG